METSNTQRRITKRSSYACTRCRRQKIKCSGLNPCSRCAHRRLPCVFDEKDNKILVTQGYLTDLEQKIARLEALQSSSVTRHGLDQAGDAVGHVRHGGSHRRSPSLCSENQAPGGHNTEAAHSNSPSRVHGDAEAPELTNPLTTRPSQYMAASNGMPFYLGTSSNWSFSRRALAVTHEHVRRSPLPTDTLLFDACAYELGWDGYRTTQTPDCLPVVPSIDYAIFLVNAVKFHCGQLFHIFEEDEFMANLDRFYSDPPDHQVNESSLWYIHFLLVMAFGKSLIQRKNHGRRPAGAEFFVKALQLLPEPTALCKEPALATEILYFIAWYYQALDFRHAAHMFIGQAKSMAMNHGMHTDMPIMELGETFVQRCRKIWWTVYVLDRQMTSLMGLPQSVRDEGVSSQLPSYPGSAQRTASINMQIRFARIIAEISRTIYSTNGRLNKRFVVSTKAVLESIADVADELHTSFPLQADERFDGISRLAAHLHLLYYQCVVLATRPLLLCCLIKRFESPLEADSLTATPKIRTPLQMCVESSQVILNILDKLRAQGLLETFLPLDLDSLFVATVALLVAGAVDSHLVEGQSWWLAKSNASLEEMITSGNLVANFRKFEMQELRDMLNEFVTLHSQASSGAIRVLEGTSWHQPSASTSFFPDPAPGGPDGPLEDNMMLPCEAPGKEGNDEVDDLTAQQIMTVANMMEWDDAGWISFDMTVGQT